MAMPEPGDPYAKLLVSEPMQCWRVIHDRQLQAAHCLETPSWTGRMVASDGGVPPFGDAPFLGSAGSQQLASPIAGMFANGNGYTLVAQDGTLYPFG